MDLYKLLRTYIIDGHTNLLHLNPATKIVEECVTDGGFTTIRIGTTVSNPLEWDLVEDDLLHIAVVIAPDKTYLDMIVVPKKVRGTGLASQLISVVCNYVKHRNVNEGLPLSLYLSDTSPAYAGALGVTSHLIEKHGITPVEEL